MLNQQNMRIEHIQVVLCEAISSLQYECTIVSYFLQFFISSLLVELVWNLFENLSEHFRGDTG